MGRTSNAADSRLKPVARVFYLLLETTPWIVGASDAGVSMQCNNDDVKSGGHDADKQLERFSQVTKRSQTCVQSTVIAEHTRILTSPSTTVCFSVHKATFNRRQLSGTHLD